MTLQQAFDVIFSLVNGMRTAERPILYLLANSIEFGSAIKVVVDYAILKITGGDEGHQGIVMEAVATDKVAHVHAALAEMVALVRSGTDPEPQPLMDAQKVGVFPWFLIASMAFELLKKIWENRQQ